jgi:hypothetical protein
MPCRSPPESLLRVPDPKGHAMHELATRTNDGIHVRLLWRSGDNRGSVAVDDAKTGDSFVLAVAADENAMDVFHHPYAYVAWRGVATQPELALTGQT